MREVEVLQARRGVRISQIILRLFLGCKQGLDVALFFLGKQLGLCFVAGHPKPGHLLKHLHIQGTVIGVQVLQARRFVGGEKWIHNPLGNG